MPFQPEQSPAPKPKSSREVTVVSCDYYPPMEEAIPNPADRQRYQAVVAWIDRTRQRYGLNELDHARLHKPFLSDKGGVGARLNLRMFGCVNLHRGRKAGAVFEPDWIDNEFYNSHAQSPLNLEGVNDQQLVDIERSLVDVSRVPRTMPSVPITERQVDEMVRGGRWDLAEQEPLDFKRQDVEGSDPDEAPPPEV